MKLAGDLKHRWRYFWTKRAGWRALSRLAGHLAAIGSHPYHGRSPLSSASPRGFVAPSASIAHDDLRLGRHVLINDRCFLLRVRDGDPITLDDEVQLFGETTLQTGAGGSIHIGRDTHIQPRCNFSAHVGSIVVGARVEIAPCCAFYSYNHGVEPGIDIMRQPLWSRGGIRIGDGAWLGHGVIVLDGVEIGEGAVIAVGAVVNRSIPANAIAGGAPAKVIRFRGDPRS